MVARAGIAKIPPVPTKNDVRLGIVPNPHTYLEDLNFFPSGEMRFKFSNRFKRESLLFNGKLFVIISWMVKFN